MTSRIHYLDWLKVLIVYGIVVFHVSLVFGVGTWLVSNHDRSLVLSAFVGFCFPWGIPAMFLIAGADAWLGLRSHSLGHFIKGRIQRLLIPMIVGLVLLTPFQRFVTSQNPPPPFVQLGEFYLAFFRSFHFSADLQWVATYSLHLWFLGYLFVISIACGPLLIWLHRPAGRSLVAGLVRIAGHRGGLYAVGAPLVASQVVLRPLFPEYQDWADVATYTYVFVTGAIVFSDRRFETAIRRDIRWFLVTGMVAISVLGAIMWASASPLPSATNVPPGVAMTYGLFWGLEVWSWLMAVLYLGLRWFDFPSRAVDYLQESVLPVYVIHHPVVLVIASFVVTSSAGVWPKFAVILALTFALTLTLYEFGVRRWRVTRMMFGLKPFRGDAGTGEGGGPAQARRTAPTG